LGVFNSGGGNVIAGAVGKGEVAEDGIDDEGERRGSNRST